jgi:hypothetical protein
MLKKIIATSIFSLILIASIQMVSAAGLVPDASGTASCNGTATYCGDYTLGDFIKLAVLASQWILGIVGSLSLIMFIYGGFMFLISSGSSDKVGQAKKIIIAAVIGLLIVFSSYLIIKFVVGALGANGNYQLGGKSTTIIEDASTIKLQQQN